jgi:hypothetical protein
MYSGSSRNEVIASFFLINSLAISLVEVFPVRNQIIFGGWPLIFAMSIKSESKLTIQKEFNLEKFHISISLEFTKSKFLS